MSAGLFNSDSTTKVRVSMADNRIAAAEGSKVSAPRANVGKKGNINQASEGGMVVSGKGNTVSVSSTDYGAIQEALKLAGLALENQSNLSATALGAASDNVKTLKDLAETKTTGGENLSNKNVQIALVAAAAVSLIALLYKK